MCFIMIIGSFSCKLQIQKWIAILVLEEAEWLWRSPPSPSSSLMFCLTSLHIPEQRTERRRSRNKTQDLFYEHLKGIRRWRIDDKGFLCHGGHFISNAHLVKCLTAHFFWFKVQGENDTLCFFFLSGFFFLVFFSLVPVQEAHWSIAEIRIPIFADI